MTFDLYFKLFCSCCVSNEVAYLRRRAPADELSFVVAFSFPSRTTVALYSTISSYIIGRLTMAPVLFIVRFCSICGLDFIIRRLHSPETDVWNPFLPFFSCNGWQF